MIDPEIWIKAKQEYLSGGVSLRSLAKKYNMAQSTMVERSQREDWKGQKKAALTLAKVQDIERSADNRVEKIKQDLAGRLSDIIDDASHLCARLSAELRRAPIADLDTKDMTTMLRLLSETMGKINELSSSDNAISNQKITILFPLPDLQDSPDPNLPVVGRSIDQRAAGGADLPDHVRLSDPVDADFEEV